MKLRLSVLPVVSPIAQHQIDELPIPPTNTYRGWVAYESDELQDGESVSGFIALYASLHEEFCKAFGTNVEYILRLIGAQDEDVILRSQDFEWLQKIQCELVVGPSGIESSGK